MMIHDDDDSEEAGLKLVAFLMRNVSGIPSHLLFKSVTVYFLIQLLFHSV